jgi:hypothetical protein
MGLINAKTDRCWVRRLPARMSAEETLSDDVVVAGRRLSPYRLSAGGSADLALTEHRRRELLAVQIEMVLCGDVRRDFPADGHEPLELRLRLQCRWLSPRSTRYPAASQGPRHEHG